MAAYVDLFTNSKFFCINHSSAQYMFEEPFGICLLQPRAEPEGSGEGNEADVAQFDLAHAWLIWPQACLNTVH